MEFNIVTGFGKSLSSFQNNADQHQIGQGVLQGSSSAAPLYNINSDICLTAYRKLAKGTTFQHPISSAIVEDKATQYVDDKTDMLNDIGAGLRRCQHLTMHDRTQLFTTATENANTRASLLWMSGGQLNTNKCFYYFLKPKYNFTSNTTKYLSSSLIHPITGIT
jgi:hypothetical protein